MKLIVLFFSSVASYEIISKCIDVNHIAITFDDGIHANTEKILDILDYHDVSATFFVNGENIKDKKSEDVAKRIYNSNNIIATHTYSHPYLTTLNEFNLMREFYDNELVFRNFFGVRPLYWRPPYFDYNDIIADRIYNTFGYILITANINTFDYEPQSTNQSVIENFISGLNKNESITLQHDYASSSLTALDTMINYIKSSGKNAVNIKECINSVHSYQLDNQY